MRESYRLQKSILTAETNHKGLAIFFIYNGNGIPVYVEVFEKIGMAIQRLKKMIDEAGTLHS